MIAHAVGEYGLPKNLKLSVHSGSDKFSLYPVIRRALERSGAGLHLKTAGDDLAQKELIGLAESGTAKDWRWRAKSMAQALEHIGELCGPYASVIDIRSREAAVGDRSGGLERRAVRRRVAPHSRPGAVQSAFPPTTAHRLQTGGQNWNALHRLVGSERNHHRQKRDGESVRAAFETAVPGMKSAVTISLVAEAKGGPFVFWDNLAEGCAHASRLGFDAVEIFPSSPSALRVGEVESN